MSDRNLESATLPDPVANSGEILLRVRACALNHLDIWIRNGLPGSKVKTPHVRSEPRVGDPARPRSQLRRDPAARTRLRAQSPRHLDPQRPAGLQGQDASCPIGTSSRRPCPTP